MLGERCIRCGIGIDHDGDGNCGFCAGLTERDIIYVKGLIQALKRQNKKGENGRRI